jgi:hypothetical protein
LIALWIAGGVVAVLAAGVVSYAARIRARHQRFLRSAPPAALVPDAGRILDQPQALYHGTKFADGVRLFASGWKEPCVCDVWCTEQGLFIRREGQGALLAIAHEEVVEASLHRAFAKIAGDDLPMLRLRWRRGGESMVTELSLRGGMASLEALRREIHLRQGNVAKQLAPLLTRTPE